ncbi:tetratricopeptide repeat protein [Streptomyces sp. NPDC127110]|uniref:tetratricopeptide repeat protein n=1 Tax=Streptomyces sp. NPDC127110 TaxID=3345362 RepID=UPI0036276DF6
MRRYTETDDPEFLYELMQLGVLPQSVPGRPAGHLYVLAATALIERFDATEESGYLDKAISMLRGARLAQPPGDPQHHRILHDLGSSLRSRFERKGDRADLDEAVEIGRQTVLMTRPGAPGHPDHAGMLSELGNALMARFHSAADRSDLDEAIECHRRAVDCEASPGRRRAMYLNNLGSALRFRFADTGRTAALEEAVDVCRSAVAAAPADGPDDSGLLANLSLVLQSRFGRFGDPADLDQAIAHARQAVRLLREGDPNLRKIRLVLGGVLRSRFEWRRSLGDLDEAIAQFRLVAESVPADHAQHTAYVADLASALLVRFGATGDMSDYLESAGYARPRASRTVRERPEAQHR